MPIELATLSPCPFCDYLAGVKGCAFIRRNQLVSSFVNRAQYELGAILIVSNAHLATLLDLPADTLAEIGAESQLLGKALIKEFGAIGLNVFQNNGIHANQHVPHYHMHLVPRYPGSDSTKIYQQGAYEPISISEQTLLAKRIANAVA